MAERSDARYDHKDRDKNRLFMTFNIYLDDYSGNYDLPSWIVDPNPKDLSINSRMVETKTQMYHGFYEECWGEGLGTISASGTTRGFYLPSEGYVGDDQRFDTASYINYRVLLEVFKNNGTVYDSDGNVFHQGDITLTYDKFVYYGRFTDFRTEFQKPFMYDVSFSFEYGKRLRVG